MGEMICLFCNRMNSHFGLNYSIIKITMLALRISMSIAVAIGYVIPLMFFIYGQNEGCFVLVKRLLRQFVSTSFRIMHASQKKMPIAFCIGHTLFENMLLVGGIMPAAFLFGQVYGIVVGTATLFRVAARQFVISLHQLRPAATKM